MRRSLYHFFYLILLATSVNLHSSSCQSSSTACSTSSCSSSNGNAICKTVFLPFSQGENRARDYAGISSYQFLPDVDYFNYHFDVAIEYQENFKRADLGAYFFPNGTNLLTVGPTIPDQEDLGITVNPPVDVTGFNIILSDTFLGTLTINPRIRNVIAEPQLYIGLDHWVQGAWFWMKVPITNTRWTLDCCETDSLGGGQIFGTFFLSGNFQGVCPAFGQPNQIQLALGGDLETGDMQTPLLAGKFLCCESKLTWIADIPMHLGYNFLLSKTGYLGAYVRAVFPTGHTKNRQSVFDATVGYDRWQLGFGLNGGVALWHDEDTSIKFIADAYYTYIFNKSQCRVFDLAANGCFSRYLRMCETDASGNYTGKLVDFVDVFTFCVESKFNWNFDGLAFLELKHKGWIADVGYEVKARARESFEVCPMLSLCNPCVEDDCGQSCCNIPPTDIDSKQYGILSGGAPANFGTQVQTRSKSTINQIAPKDPTPVLINQANVTSQLDLCGGTIPQALSHKVWANFGYTWEDREYPVVLSIGGEAEFGNDNTALSLGGIWAKGGFAYN